MKRQQVSQHYQLSCNAHRTNVRMTQMKSDTEFLTYEPWNLSELYLRIRILPNTAYSLHMPADYIR